MPRADKWRRRARPPRLAAGRLHTTWQVFGPVMCVMRFATDAEAVRLANESAFGLGCSVFSGSSRRANRIAAGVRCGMVSINDFASYALCQALPFGGIKESGFGRFGGAEGLRGCCLVKAVAQDRWTLLKTRIPIPLQYPLADHAFAFQRALVQMFFGTTLALKARGLYALVLTLLWRKKARSPQAPE